MKSKTTYAPVEEWLGQRVVVTTIGKVWKGCAYEEKVERIFIGKLDTIRQNSLTLDHWFEAIKIKDGAVVEWKDDIMKYDKYIMHAGSTKEMETIELCVLTGGPRIGSSGPGRSSY